jgi:amino acid permease
VAALELVTLAILIHLAARHRARSYQGLVRTHACKSMLCGTPACCSQLPPLLPLHLQSMPSQGADRGIAHVWCKHTLCAHLRGHPEYCHIHLCRVSLVTHVRMAPQAWCVGLLCWHRGGRIAWQRQRASHMVWPTKASACQCVRSLHANGTAMPASFCILQVKAMAGQRSADAMATVIALYLFGSCVAFMIIAGDSTRALLARSRAPTALRGRAAAVALPACLIMLPLSLQRSMGALAGTSTLAVAIMAATALIIAAKAAAAVLHGKGALMDAAGLAHDASYEEQLDKVASSAPGVGGTELAAFAAVAIMVFAYQCHVQVVPIFHELEARPSLLGWLQVGKAEANGLQAEPLPVCADDSLLAGGRHAAAAGSEQAGDGSRAVPSQQTSSTQHTAAALDVESPASAGTTADGQQGTRASKAKLRGMCAVLLVASCTCTALYLITGAAGLALFGAAAKSNVLNNFAPDDALMQLVSLAVGLAVVLHYPINHHAARSAVYDLACRTLGHPAAARPPYAHVAAATAALFAATLVTACLVSDLGVVFRVVGGVAGSAIIFVLPGALLVLHARPRGALASHASERANSHVRAASNGRDAVPTSGAEVIEAARGDGERAGASDTAGGAAGGGGGVLALPARLLRAMGWALIDLGCTVMFVTLYTTLLAPG